jgi:cell division protein FtsA
VQQSGTHIDALVLEPLASGEAVLTDIEREMGVALIDIGGGTTDIAIFIEGSIWHAVVLPTGGEQITNDVAVGLRTPYDMAEDIKIKYGHALPQVVMPEEVVKAEVFGEDGQQQIPRQFLAEIIGARIEEIFELVLKEIKRSGYDGLLPAGIVLCGGTAQLPGIRELARPGLCNRHRVVRMGCNARPAPAGSAARKSQPKGTDLVKSLFARINVFGN